MHAGIQSGCDGGHVEHPDVVGTGGVAGFYRVLARPGREQGLRRALSYSTLLQMEITPGWLESGYPTKNTLLQK